MLQIAGVVGDQADQVEHILKVRDKWAAKALPDLGLPGTGRPFPDPDPGPVSDRAELVSLAVGIHTCFTFLVSILPVLRMLHKFYPLLAAVAWKVKQKTRADLAGARPPAAGFRELLGGA